MKIMITGVNGQLGRDVLRELLRRRHRCLGNGLKEAFAGAETEPLFSYLPLDITREEAVLKTVSAFCPDLIVHCAAWTDVDAAELPINRPLAEQVNHLGTRHIARAAASTGAGMIYISTDYVFDGRGSRPWQPDDTCFSPLNIYGESKLKGEQAVREALEKYFIVRTQWLFGQNGNSFVRTMLRLGRTRKELRVVDDQFGTPTYTPDLARLIADMAQTARYGCYHAVNGGGAVSRFDFCREIFRQAGLNARVLPVSTAEYGGKGAQRPLNGRLDTGKLAENGFVPLPDWQDALARYLKEAEIWDRLPS